MENKNIKILFVEDEPKRHLISNIFQDVLLERQKEIEDDDEFINNVLENKSDLLIDICYLDNFTDAYYAINHNYYDIIILDVKLNACSSDNINKFKNICDDYERRGKAKKVPIRFNLEDDKIVYGGIYLWSKILETQKYSEIILYTGHSIIHDAYYPFFINENAPIKIISKDNLSGIRDALIRSLERVEERIIGEEIELSELHKKLNYIKEISQNGKKGKEITVLLYEKIYDRCKWNLKTLFPQYLNNIESKGISDNKNDIVTIVNNILEIIPDEWELVGSSDSMSKIKNRITKYAKSDLSLLILGETGTGKEVVAKEIHKRSGKKAKPFIAVNCGAIPENLIESELFGYEPRAFTGAGNKIKTGYFEQANGGTIFLDEIGDITKALQVKLLRVLQEKEFIRIGGEKAIKVDIRVIFATNANLEELVSKGKFREDLHGRISNGLTIELPPLRERNDDIPILIKHFISQKENELKRKIGSLNEKLLVELKNYNWPKNVRELKGAIDVACEVIEKGNELNIDLFKEHGIVPFNKQRLKENIDDDSQLKLWEGKFFNGKLTFDDIPDKDKLLFFQFIKNNHPALKQKDIAIKLGIEKPGNMASALCKLRNKNKL